MSRADDSTSPLVLRVEDPAVAALLPTYLARRAQDVADIRRWLAAGEFDRIAVAAHRMRGSGTAYGVEFVTDIGRDMEQAAGQGDAARVEAAVARLEATLARVELA